MKQLKNKIAIVTGANHGIVIAATLMGRGGETEEIASGVAFWQAMMQAI